MKILLPEGNQNVIRQLENKYRIFNKHRDHLIFLSICRQWDSIFLLQCWWTNKSLLNKTTYYIEGWSGISTVIPDSHLCDNFIHSICVILLIKILVASTYEVEASHVHKYILLWSFIRNIFIRQLFCYSIPGK